MPFDPNAEWYGNLQPQGILVTGPALERHGVVPNNDTSTLAALQTRLAAWIQAPHTTALMQDVLGWQPNDIRSVADLPDPPGVLLPETSHVLRPDHVVPDPDPAPGAPPWQVLIRDVAAGRDFDVVQPVGAWAASPHHLMTRLLQGTGVPTGLLVSPTAICLVYLPQGEAAGHVTFPVPEMTEVRGRPMLAALHMLLEEQRLFGAPAHRLPVLLRDSRRHQAEVSAKLSGQVLGALHALLRGLHAADRRAGTDRIVRLTESQPNHLYGGLLTALMRLVFVLYAEDRGLFPDSVLWTDNYTLSGLFTRLRDDSALNPDTMDDRFGAWAQICALSRIVHGGARHGELHLPARRGTLFDPGRYPFLEGRDAAADKPRIPRVSDATVLAMLERLLMLDGQRLLYSGLDVEQIGAVYETMMGFTVELTTGPSLAVRSGKADDVATVVNLAALLAEPPGDRGKWLKKHAERAPSDAAGRALQAARDLPALEAALHRLVDRDATPSVVPAGTPVLQPTEERRRTGSHYTPPSLTRPIVADALAPVLAALGPVPTPEQILGLRVLDPAMGSGAFLVEACRQLGAELVAAWGRAGITPLLPADQDALEHARRLVVMRCLCGVDRNPFAVEMARLSLWLATLARDHEFTFLDHALRHGDALIGLPRARIADLHWAPRPDSPQLAFQLIRPRITRAAVERQRIRDALEGEGETVLRPILARADAILDDVRLIGDAICAAWFNETTATARRQAQARLESDYMQAGQTWRDGLDAGQAVRRRLAAEGHAYHPFHWDIEFAEVFERENPGFDVVIGNPPYAGKNTFKKGNVPGFPEWLQAIHPGSHGNADLCAHFFLRGFDLLRQGGALGFVATNTIRQGDTRESGLRALLARGATITQATRRLRWPGDAAVIVCVVHLVRGPSPVVPVLDGRTVTRISAFLEEGVRDEAPKTLEGNRGKTPGKQVQHASACGTAAAEIRHFLAVEPGLTRFRSVFARGFAPVTLEASKGLAFQGSILLGMGFTFDDGTNDPAANPVAEMRRLTDPAHAQGAHNTLRIRPYIGGEEVNDSPTHAHRRWAIDFADFPLERRDDLAPGWAEASPERRAAYLSDGVVPADYPEPVAADWPELLKIVRDQVKPKRDGDNREAYRKFWWRYAERRAELAEAVASIDHVLAISRVSPHLTFARLDSGAVFAETLFIFVQHGFSNFAILQSRMHEVWARFFSSSLEDRLRYAPSDCLETFPFASYATLVAPALAEAGKTFHDARAVRMVSANEGLTATHNRLDDPEELDPAILHLRTLHDEMDTAVLRAYGWPHAIPVPVHEPEWPGGEDDPPGSWRRRWPEADRARVLEFLWQLNEAAAATQATAPARPPVARRRARRSTPQPDLLDLS